MKDRENGRQQEGSLETQQFVHKYYTHIADSRHILVEEKPITLSPSQNSILTILEKSIDVTVPAETITTLANTANTIGTLSTNVSRLNSAIKQERDIPNVINKINGGYRLESQPAESEKREENALFTNLESSILEFMLGRPNANCDADLFNDIYGTYLSRLTFKVYFHKILKKLFPEGQEQAFLESYGVDACRFVDEEVLLERARGKAGEKENDVVRLTDFAFFTEGFAVFDEKRVSLKPTHTDILKKLTERVNSVVPYANLCKVGEDITTELTLQKKVSALNKVLMRGRNIPFPITEIVGVGYIINDSNFPSPEQELYKKDPSRYPPKLDLTRRPGPKRAVAENDDKVKTTKEHPHSWLIDENEGQESLARCKRCGATRHFKNWSSDEAYKRGESVFTDE